MTVAMTITARTRKHSLRQLAAADLRAVTGGIIIYGSTSTTTVGNPEESATFTGGVSYLPAIQR